MKRKRPKESTTSSEEEGSESSTEDPRNPARVRRLLRRQLARGSTLLADVEASRQLAPKQETVPEESQQDPKIDDPRQDDCRIEEAGGALQDEGKNEGGPGQGQT